MAYADALDPAIPDGTDQRRFGDDAIRQLTRAVRARLATFFVDIDADPLVLKDGAIGTSAKLADFIVTTAKLANLSVATGKLVDRAVTSIKLDLDAVLAEHIGPGTFGFDGVSSSAGYQVGGAAPANQVLVGNGTWGLFRALLAADIPDAVLQLMSMKVEGFYTPNVPGGSASYYTRYNLLGGTDEHMSLMTRAGEIRGAWVRGNADTTAGEFRTFVFSNPADPWNVALPQVVIDVANPRQRFLTFAAGAYPFAAGTRLGLSWVSAGLTPGNSTEFVGGFEVRYT